jgi:hypothetical protein
VATSTITGTITDPTGVAVASVPVVCRLMPTGGFRSADGSEVSRAVSTTTNASGVYTLVLERNSGISPANTYYEITESIPAASGGTRVWTISVGASNQTVFAALVTPAPAAASTYLTQASADARYQALSAIGSDTPTTSAVADAATAGVSTAASRGDHKHGRESFATPVATASSGNSAGAAATLPRSDHVHQSPGTLGYAQVTANQGGFSAETDLTSLAVTVTVGSGRRIRISFCGLTERTVADGVNRFAIKEGATTLQLVDEVPTPASITKTATGSVILTPTAGSHTYKLTLQRVTGTGTVQLTANATFPFYILVEDIGT